MFIRFLGLYLTFLGLKATHKPVNTEINETQVLLKTFLHHESDTYNITIQP